MRKERVLTYIEGYWDRIRCDNIGLGMFESLRKVGSTVPYVVDRIVGQGKLLNKDRVFIPTGEQRLCLQRRSLLNALVLGFQSKQLIVQAGLNLGDVDQYPTIDVTLDGADE
jgi:ribose 5-phosphate isomerase A